MNVNDYGKYNFADMLVSIEEEMENHITALRTARKQIGLLWNACDRMGTGCHCTMDTGTETGPYSKKPGRNSGTDKPDDRRGIQGDASECKENRRAS